MFAKIFLVAAVIAAISAVKIHEHGHASSILIHKLEEPKKHIVLIQPVEVPHKIQEVQHNAHESHHEKHDYDYYAEPKYEYEYQIKDPHTHDIKEQHETRHGDVVKGEYSVHQPDGTIRTVKYHADKKTGFHADVKYTGHAKHIVPEHHHHH